MSFLSWWFRGTGLVYLVLGASWLPVLNAPKLEAVVPGFDGPLGGTAYRGFLDWLLMFGLEMLVLGAVLIYASWRPRWQEPLLWLVVGLSLVRGIAHDLYMISAGYSVVANLLFVALHATIIVTGLLALRAAKRAVAVPVVEERDPAISR